MKKSIANKIQSAKSRNAKPQPPAKSYYRDPTAEQRVAMAASFEEKQIAWRLANFEEPKPLGTKHYTKAELSARFQAGVELTEVEALRLFGIEPQTIAKVKKGSREEFMTKMSNHIRHAHGMPEEMPLPRIRKSKVKKAY